MSFNCKHLCCYNFKISEQMIWWTSSVIVHGSPPWHVHCCRTCWNFHIKPHMNQDSCSQLLLHLHCWLGGQTKNVFVIELVPLIYYSSQLDKGELHSIQKWWLTRVDRDVYVDLQVRQKYNPWLPSHWHYVFFVFQVEPRLNTIKLRWSWNAIKILLK
jgi:hypothetical protein